MKIRNTNIDAIKGGAILLVVLGHSIQLHDPCFDENVLFRLIYSFHMPLFMAISGWIARPQEFSRLKHLAIRLGVPTIVWYLVQYLIQKQYNYVSLGEYLWKFVEHPDVGLWFLWVLLLCHLLLSASYWLERHIGVVSYALILCAAAVPFPYFGLSLARYYFFYFALAYLVARNLGVWRRAVPLVAVFAFVFVYIACFRFWHRSFICTDYVITMPTQMYNLDTKLKILFFWSIKLIAAISGSVLFSIGVVHIRVSAVKRALSWLGRRTLEIYAVHQLLVPLVGKSDTLGIMVAFTFALSGSLLIATLAGMGNYRLYGLLYGSQPIRG